MTATAELRREDAGEGGPAACPACGARDATIVLDDARDWEYGVPGSFRFARCGACGLCYLTPRPTLERLRTYYPADYHAHRLPTSSLFRLLHRMQFGPRVRRYLGIAGDVSGGRVLDVGCGDGTLLRELGRRAPCELHGLDFNPDAIAAARAGEPPIHLFLGTLEDAPYAERTFDLVVMHHVLEHVLEPATTLGRVRALLRPGGHVVGQLPNFASLERAVMGRFWNGYHTPRHMQCFTPPSLAALLRRSGFDRIATGPAAHPGQWALSLQSFLVGRVVPRARRAHGKTSFYPGCLAAGLPLAVADVVIRAGGVMNFSARRPPEVAG
jgi:SAM-dependent methyltransferase